MKRTMWAVLTLAVAAAGANIDGKWTAEMQMRGRGGDAAAQSRKVEVTLDLKSTGDQLTGDVVMNTPRGDRRTPIQDGRIEGDKFSFTTTQKNRQGEMKMKWSGTVQGDRLTGERSRAEARRGVQFTAKRAN